MKTKSSWSIKRISLNLSTLLILLSFTLFGGFTLGHQWENLKTHTLPYLGAKKPSIPPEWQDLTNLYNTLNANYDGEIDRNELLLGAKKGLVESIGDEYTIFMSAKEHQDFEKSLHGDVGAGVGIEMGVRDNLIRVIRTLPDNPAKKAGILAGDIIYKVNGEEVHKLTTDKVAEKVRGPVGTEVNLTIVRNNQELNFTIKREKINNVSAYISYQDQTAIITITRFDTDTANLVKSFIDEFPAKNVNKLILDLRNNGGGFLDTAVELLSFWLSGQKALIQKSKHHADNIIHTTRGQDRLKDMKTVILINGSTASASEIMAGALKDHQKATLVGEKTYGKGVVQGLLKLSGGELLKVTTARWHTPNGHSINKTGISPDHLIPRSFDDINTNKDPQLDFAKNL